MEKPPAKKFVKEGDDDPALDIHMRILGFESRTGGITGGCDDPYTELGDVVTGPDTDPGYVTYERKEEGWTTQFTEGKPVETHDPQEI